MIRIGLGFDVHQLVDDRPFVLGGITIPWPKGPLGHSDGDALLHAICDALLGAASLRDIGSHFPDTDNKFKNIDSIILLQSVNELLSKHGFTIGNLDCTIALQQPKLMDYIPQMQEKIAAALNSDIFSVSIKATTTENLGFTGRGEGIAVWAVALLYTSVNEKK